MIVNIFRGISYTGTTDFSAHRIVKNTEIKTPIFLKVASKYGFIIPFTHIFFLICK
jgi:hypothetical protein